MSALRIHSFPGKKSAMLLRSISPYSHSSLTLLQFTPKPLFATTNNFSRLHAATLTTTTTSTAPHPWPEWVSFVDRLNSRGYLPRHNSDADIFYRDLKLLKDPCLTFARDRLDIFESLSKDDIQHVVEVGCPKLVRKVVNSAKRLRVYVGLQEKTVCDACSLKGSCNRAYLKPNESESVKTVDIIRLLLFYALDPMVISEAVRSTSNEQAEFSARRLLRMIMDLSEVPKDPDNKEKIANSTAAVLSEDTARWEGQWICPKCNFMNFTRNTQCHKCSKDGPMKLESALVEPRKGDWNCPKCKFLNFARNNSCRECDEDAPKKRERINVELKNGDWHCPRCSFMNFSRNTQCHKCSEDGPMKQESALVEPRKGDWNCPKCKFLNFAKNNSCRQCDEDAPKKRERKHVELKKGDWCCPKCNFLNYSRNMQCRKCNEGAPETREMRLVEPKKGDWDCPQCVFVNFASRANCLKCATTRPAQTLNTGEWVCSKCCYLNFRRNITCLKCAGEQVKDAGALHEQHVWKKPVPATVN